MYAVKLDLFHGTPNNSSVQTTYTSLLFIIVFATIYDLFVCLWFCGRTSPISDQLTKQTHQSDL